MKAKKLLVMLLVMIMLISSLGMTAFAEEQTQEPFPNIMGTLDLNNYDCEHYEEFTGKTDVKLVVSKGDFSVDIPLEWDADLEWYYTEGNIPELDAVITEVGPVYEEIMYSEEMVDVLKECGYTVSVEGIDAEHFNEVEITCDVMTAESLRESLDMIIGLLNGLIQEADPEAEEIESFDELLVMYEEILRDPENEYTEEEIQEELAAIQAYNDMVLALEDGTYAGELMLTVNVLCECPVVLDYDVYHTYYNSETDYVDVNYGTEKVEVGQEINVADSIKTEYDGKTYKVKAIYDGYGEDITDNPIIVPTEDDWWIDVYIEYELVDQDSGALGEEDRLEDDQKLEYKVTVEKDEYTLTSGNTFTVTGDGEFAEFEKVLVDGEVVDKAHYSVKEGSTIITFNSAYLDTLEIGEHTVKMVWSTGDSNTGVFNVVKAAVLDEDNSNELDESNKEDESDKEELKEEPKDEEKTPVDEPEEEPTVEEEPEIETEVPTTSDETNVLLYVLLMAAAAFGIKKVRA